MILLLMAHLGTDELYGTKLSRSLSFTKEFIEWLCHCMQIPIQRHQVQEGKQRISEKMLDTRSRICWLWR